MVRKNRIAETLIISSRILLLGGLLLEPNSRAEFMKVAEQKNRILLTNWVDCNSAILNDDFVWARRSIWC